MPALAFGWRIKTGVLPALFLLFGAATPGAWGQQPGLESGTRFAIAGAPSQGSRSASISTDVNEPDKLARWFGIPVRDITFEGLSKERFEPLANHLPQAV